MVKIRGLIIVAGLVGGVMLGAGAPLAPAPAGAVPANDNFANAVPITSMMTDPVAAVGNTVGATMEVGEPSPCGGMASTVWYSWTTPGGDGHITLDTLGSNYDTVMAVYTGNAINALTLLYSSACNDDFFGSHQSGVTFEYDNLATTTYWIQVGGFGGATGDIVINFSRGATMVVTASNDNVTTDFALSLREAIGVANNPNIGICPLVPEEQAFVLSCGVSGNQFADLIHFSAGFFPPTAPITIPLNSSLPPLNNSGDVISGIGAGVIIDGQNAGFSCLTVTGTGNVIQGLDIRRCARGIVIDGGFANLIGVDIWNTPVLPAERNLLRENATGLRIVNTSGANDAYGNYIGTNEAGAAGIGNNFGVVVEASANQFIGVPGAGRNVISGNSSNGVYLASSFQTSIVGNLIGTNPAGTAALGNGGYGILVQDSSASQIARNVISGNTLQGIHVFTVSPGISTASDNLIAGNFIGTNAAGTAGLPNSGGITLANASGNTIGETTANQRNIISGNSIFGVQIIGPYATRNVVQGNYIGTNAAGTATLASGGQGVQVEGNATSNTVGGSAPGAGNLISGHTVNGALLYGAGGGISAYNSTDVPKAIADFTTASSVIDIPERATIKDMKVTLDITHTFDGDLTISLRSPGGVTAPLSIRNGSSGDNYTNTTFDDAIGISINDGAPPFTGTWVPEGSLAQFEGGPTNGTWTLLVADDAGADQGALNSWSLSFVTDGNEVAGNYIGTNAAGTQALGNHTGVLVYESRSNTIGGTTAGARNVISGNSFRGVRLEGPGATGNVVLGNYIGTNAAGSQGLGNGGGVELDGAPGNFIGGGSASARNVISANSSEGVVLQTAAGNFIGQNYIGLDAGGTLDLGNATAGVSIDESPNSTVNGNVVSGNGTHGVEVQGSASTVTEVKSNLIGTNAAGTADLGNTNHGLLINLGGSNRIGGPAAANLISGNGGDGIVITESPFNTLQTNYIGADTTGVLPIGNSGRGLVIENTFSNNVGGSDETERNVIGANGSNAVAIIGGDLAGGHVIQGNNVGVAGDDVTPMGNGGGIVVSGQIYSGFIGNNIIAHNGSPGISLVSASGQHPQQQLYRNRIFANTGLGIDISADGVSANDIGDGDLGPNQRQNFPELEYGDYSGGQVSIVGKLNSLPNESYLLQFFFSTSCDASGHGEGATFVGETNLATDGVGSVSFVVNFVGPPLAGFLTATATYDDDGHTSEFSNCTPANANGDDDGDGYANKAEFGSIMCMSGANDDPLDDGVANDGCPGGPAKAGAFSEAQYKIGTGSTDPCGYDGWPSNVWEAPPSANTLDVQDIISFVAPVRRLDRSPPNAAFSPRWDLAPGPNTPFPNFISIVDITTILNGGPGSPAYPPMFSGPRAFLKDCPFPP